MCTNRLLFSTILLRPHKQKVAGQTMYNLQRKIREQNSTEPKPNSGGTGRLSIRDYLLTQEIAEIREHLPSGCAIDIADPDILHEIVLRISPQTGYWKEGTFVFAISVPSEYNIMPPAVSCRTKLWHPNIDMEGNVCLSILRSRSIDSTGWAPTRTLKDVVWGLNALFGDLLNFEDPLNVEAAEQYTKDKELFIRKVEHYVTCYAS
ncbi:NEDD8-conjugating enzyme UBE2F-like [Watersipora subatra]|uniref:NEDD8-conjugating enzyme UBE2F-like n=1 Tax=Watersipora subatra TaxID=2589382 RepID=UPI00355BE90E